MSSAQSVPLTVPPLWLESGCEGFRFVSAGHDLGMPSSSLVVLSAGRVRSLGPVHSAVSWEIDSQLLASSTGRTRFERVHDKLTFGTRFSSTMVCFASAA